MISAFLTVATVCPPRSISIVSRTRSFFSWIVKSSSPDGVLQHQRLADRSALPSTLNTRWPSSFSIQKSSPIANIFSRIRYFVPPSDPARRNSPMISFLMLRQEQTQGIEGGSHHPLRMIWAVHGPAWGTCGARRRRRQIERKPTKHAPRSSVKARGEALRARGLGMLDSLEEKRPKHASVEVAFRWLLRDKEIAGGVSVADSPTGPSSGDWP